MAALTPIQQQRLGQAYLSDAQARGLDERAMIRELLQFIFADRPTQLQQLQNLVARVRATITTQQGNFDTNKAAELAGLNQVGTNLDDLSTTLPTIT